nr:hypothetical protein [Tanacetum cinerariifolium]
MLPQRSYQLSIANHSSVVHHQYYQAPVIYQPSQASFPPMDSRLVFLLFLPSDDPIASLNKEMAGYAGSGARSNATAYKVLLNTAYRTLCLRSFFVKCKHRYVVSSLMDTTYRMSEQTSESYEESLAIRTTLANEASSQSESIASRYKEVNVVLMTAISLLRLAIGSSEGRNNRKTSLESIGGNDACDG